MSNLCPKAEPFHLSDRFIANLTKISLNFSNVDLIPNQKILISSPQLSHCFVDFHHVMAFFARPDLLFATNLQ